jgi:hypothetical protein
MSNQGLLQESIRGITSTTHVFNGDWLALFALSNITTGTWDERCLQWINLELTSSYTNLADAQHAYALSQGFDRWSDMSGLAPNVEQDTGNQTTTAATSDTATFTNATVSGRGVIVVFALKGGKRVSTLVDNRGNTYNRVGFAVDESDAVVEMWYAQQITGGASHVITVTYDAAANCVWGAIEVSRVKGGGGLLDAPSVATVTRGGSGSSASVTVTSNRLRDRNELVVAMLSLAGGGANAGIDTPTNYTAITQFNDYDGVHAGHGAYRTATSTAAQSATWTNDTTTAPYAAIIAAFRAVGAASVSGTAPVNTVVPAITGTTTDGQTLTSDTGTWSGTVVSYTYQWKADGVNISGATASTYLLTASEIGANITVAVTATNEVGSTTATSAAVGPIESSYTYILDGLSSSATAAFSLRKLRTSYAGSAIKVRRSSDNTEQDIGFVDNLLDTASLLTFCGAGDGFIRTWYDQTGNARHLQQATNANQPRIVAAGAVEAAINSKPAIQALSASQHFMTGPAISNLISAANYATVMAARPISAPAPGVPYLNGGFYCDSAGYFWCNQWNTPAVAAGHWDTAARTATKASPAVPYNGVITHRRETGQSIRVTVNGGAEATQAANNVNTLTGTITIAKATGASYFRCHYAELVFFNAYVSTADMNTYGADLASYIGETWTTIT